MGLKGAINPTGFSFPGWFLYCGTSSLLTPLGIVFIFYCHINELSESGTTESDYSPRSGLMENAFFFKAANVFF